MAWKRLSLAVLIGVAALVIVLSIGEIALFSRTSEHPPGPGNPPKARTWKPGMGPPKAGDEYVNPTDGSVLVWLPGGEFTMGSNDGDADEKPPHKIKVAGFWLGKFEVTNEQWAKYMKAQGEDPPLYWDDKDRNQPKQPVVGMTWLAAQRYCEWAGVRFPTEVEWEYAAAGGKQLKHPTATGEISHDLANVRGAKGKDRWEYASPVGSFPPNPFGLYDLAGNAWEWTGSTFAAYPYSASDGREDTEETHALRVLRGGAADSTFSYCRTSYRRRFASHLRYDYAGMRVALTKAGIKKKKEEEDE